MKEIGGNPSKGFVCAGVSAGANFAAVVSHVYRDEKITPPLTGLYLSIPRVSGPEVVPDKYKARYLSHEQNKDAPILNHGVMKLLESSYFVSFQVNALQNFLWQCSLLAYIYPACRKLQSRPDLTACKSVPLAFWPR
jgi:acetyl esterase/lipase